MAKKLAAVAKTIVQERARRERSTACAGLPVAAGKQLRYTYIV